MDEAVIITKELRGEIMKRVRTSRAYMQLSAAYQEYRMKGHWNQARLVCQKMKKIEDDVLKEVVKNYKYEKREMTDIIAPMSSEDKERMNAYANGLIMMSDVIEVFISEINQTIKKYNPDMRLTSFNELRRLADEAKKQVVFFDDTYKDEYVSNLFGITADKLNEMIFNKAKSFCNKVKAHAEKTYKEIASNAEVA